MYKKSKKLLAWGLVVCMILSNMLFTNAFAAERLSGANRYETAAAIALAAYEDGADTALLAVGDKAADALAAAPLAAKLNAPILLTAKNELPEETVEALEDLGVKNVIIIGGTGAVSAEVADELEELGYDVDRISGADRFATSLAIAEELEDVEAVFVVNGQRTADALSVSPVAAANNMAIILVNGKTVSDDVLEFVDGLDVYVVGGKAVVSDDVLEAVDGERISGADRYATNVALMEAFADDMDFSVLYVASGLDAKFADALAGGILAALTNSPMVLVGADLADVTADFIEEFVPETAEIFILGGKNSVSASVVGDIEELVKGEVGDELEVVEVKAINSKQLEIKFNKAIDEDTVIAGDDTLVDGLMVVNRLPVASDNRDVDADDFYATLSDDDKVLTLTAEGNTYFDGTYAISIVADEILSKDRSESISGYTSSFKIDDTKAPTVESVTYKPATSQIEVVMSEPVIVNPAIRINGSVKTVTADPVVTDANVSDTFLVSVDTDLAGETVEVKVSGAQDYMRNVMAAYTKSIKLTKEEGDVQVVSLVQKNSNTATVKFNRAIKGANATAAETVVNDALTVMLGTTTLRGVSVTRDDDDKSNTTFDIVITNDATGPDWFYGSDKSSVTLTFFFDAGALEDVYGNTNSDDITKTLKMVKDEEGPEIVSYRVANNQKEIRIKFDQNLETISAETDASDKGVELRKSGVAQTGINIYVAANSNELVIVRTGGTKFANGEYSVRFTKGTGSLADASGNRVATQTYGPIKVDDGKTSAVEVLSIANDESGTNKFKVTFDGKVGASALVPANYSLDGVALPDDTDIVFVDDDKDEVIITLQSGAVNYSAIDSVLSVIGVKDADGNKVDVFSSPASLTVTDNTAAKLVSARLVGKSTMIFKFDEDIKASTATYAKLSDLVNDFVIKRGTISLVTSLVTSASDDSTVSVVVNGDTVTVTVTDAGTSNWNTIAASGGTITVETASGITLTDLNNVTVKDGVKVTFARQ